MEPTTAVNRVFTFNSPQAAIRNLIFATAHIEEVLSRRAVHTLIQLTAMAHPMGAEGDIVGGAFPTGDLDRLEFLGFIQLSDNNTIHLT